MGIKQEICRIPQSEVVADRGKNRVLILGSRIGGSFELRDAFREYVEEEGMIGVEIEVLRDAGMIEKVILNEDEELKDKDEVNLPKGVVLLPEMRQETPAGWMSLDTYKSGISEKVEKLCREYGIPLVMIRKYEIPNQIEQGIKEVLGIEVVIQQGR